jgi:hypothetical protein
MSFAGWMLIAWLAVGIVLILLTSGDRGCGIFCP